MGHNPFLNFDLTMCTLLYLQDTRKGKIISKQVDFHSFESILYSKMWIGSLLEHGFRKYLSWQIIQPTSFVATVWPKVEATLKKVPWVEQRWGEIVRRARKFWWKKERTFYGRSLAPYDPAL